ncbi:ComEC/Rec2 family competence protein [Wolbachia pipientis]|nr:ComEC/Rec2 family competence protein [Wolbachia pipientis]
MNTRGIINYIHNNLYKEKYNLVLWFPVLQCVGVLLYFSLNFEPNFIIIFLLALIPVCIFYTRHTILCIAITAVFIGFAASKCKTVLVNTKMLDKERYVKNVVATVKDIDHKGLYKQFLLAVFNDCLDNIKISVRTGIDSNIEIGDQVILSAKLFPLKIASSEYAYDFAKIAYYQKISATGFATSKLRLYRKAKTKKIYEYIESFRQYIYENLHNNIKTPHAGIMAALLIGKKDGIDIKTINAIRDSGISHLFAISGLHLSFVAGLFFIIFRNFFAISETLTLKYNTKKISALLTILPTTFYLLMTGMQISAQRAYIMVILVLIAIILDRKYRALIAIGFAASVLLVIEPESIFKPGFQMSFSAVLALLSCHHVRLFDVRVIQYFVSILTSSIIASLATIPYTIYNFNYFSISGIMTNLIAIPIVTLMIIPSGLFYMLLIPLKVEKFITPMIEYFIDSILYLINTITNFCINVHTFSPASILIITFGLLWICLWEQKWRLWGISFMLTGILLGITYKTPDILVNVDNIAIKENDGLLYSLNGKNKNFVIRTWARQNGQDKIFNHKKYSGNNRLKYYIDSYIYHCNNNSVLLAYTKEDVLQYCNSSDLIIQLSDFSYQKCSTHVITYSDLEQYGTHLIWSGMKVKRMRSNRPWHLFSHS